MPKTITIDVDKLSAVVASKGLASGSAAYVCKIANNDWGRITTRGWGFKDEVDLMIEHLEDKSFVVEERDEVLSPLHVKETVNGADDPEGLAEEYFAEEMAQDSPRNRLLKWFKIQFGLRPESLDVPEVEETPLLSIPKTKAAIEASEDSAAAAMEFYADELGQEIPRSILLAWFKEEYGLGPEEEEE